MASRSSPQKSADTVDVETVGRLLRNGSQHDANKPEIARAAQRLQSLGLIDTAIAEYVRCADSRDQDYQYVRDRSCRGRILLNDTLDEDGDNFHCPERGRTVYPRQKTRHRMLQVEVRPDKVAAFLEGIIAESALPWKQVQPWVWRVDTPHGEANWKLDSAIPVPTTQAAIDAAWAAPRTLLASVAIAALCPARNTYYEREMLLPALPSGDVTLLFANSGELAGARPVRNDAVPFVQYKHAYVFRLYSGVYARLVFE